MIESSIRQVEAGQSLSMQQMAQAMGRIIEGACEDGEIAQFLLALHRKGETVEEVAGAASALRAQMTPIRSRRQGVLDTCGTGGDGSRTFNISTCAALVTAAAGVPVAKHGNCGITSRSGSADALAALGVNITADVARVEACLDELGICFCYAPLLHQAMRNVAMVRKQLGVPTIFNILGPLANPARAAFQLLGVGKSHLLPLMARALTLLGTEHAVVVHGTDGLDEVTLNGPTQVVETCSAGVSQFQWTPADFGLGQRSLEALRVDGPEESAAMIRRVLSGQPGPARDVVVANAGAALWTAEMASSPTEGAVLAAQAIDSGAAQELLARLVERSR